MVFKNFGIDSSRTTALPTLKNKNKTNRNKNKEQTNKKTKTKKTQHGQLDIDATISTLFNKSLRHDESY